MRWKALQIPLPLWPAEISGVGSAHSVLEDQIRECLKLHQAEIRRNHVRYRVPDSETTVAVDPGELDAILLNLVTNAVYWIGDVPKDSRELEFRLMPINNGERIRIEVHDSGPGIGEDDKEKVFWPGVTRKPGGIGMGLTVASELVAAYERSYVDRISRYEGGSIVRLRFTIMETTPNVREEYMLNLLFIDDQIRRPLSPLLKLIKEQRGHATREFWIRRCGGKNCLSLSRHCNT